MGPPDSGDEPYFTDGAGKKLFAPNKWPEIEEFQEILTDYHRAMTSLANRMMKGFALAGTADAAERAFSIITSWLAVGRSAECGNLTWDGLRWDSLHRATCAIWRRMMST